MRMSIGVQLAVAVGLSIGGSRFSYAATDVEPVLQEIIVTAQKRAENIQDVPLSVSAFSADSLASSGITNTTQLTLVVPGLLFTQLSGQQQPFIRGIGTNTTNSDLESPVATYLDGVYLPSTAQASRELADVERVEVLKGPQGVLYGRNATGGAINIVTSDPTAETRASASMSLGNEGQEEYRAMLAGGTEQLAGSISGFISRHSGFETNLASPGSQLDTLNVKGFRAKLKYSPSDKWSIILTVDDLTENDSAGQGFTNFPGTKPLAALLGGLYSTGPRTTFANTADFPMYQVVNDRGVAITARGDLGFADFVSITSYREFKKYFNIDLGLTNLNIFAAEATYPQRTVTQEFQLLSKGTGALNWIVGSFVLGENNGYQPDVLLPGGSPTAIYIEPNQTTRSYAAFGQATYSLTSQFKVTAGVRFNKDEKYLNLLNEYEVPGPDLVNVPRQSASWTNTSPKFGLEYNPVAGQLLYASFTKAYRSGIFNLLSPGDPGPIEPEKMTAYEVGGKHDLFGGILRANWAAYQYKYKDLQVPVVDITNGITRTENAAASTSKGVDLDLTAAIGHGFTATIGIAYLDAVFDSYSNASVNLPNPTNGGYGNIPGDIDASGHTVNNSPRWSSSSQLAYSTELGSNDLKFVTGYTYNSGFFFDAQDVLKQGPYGLLSARIELTPPNKHWSFAVYGTNLTNKTVLGGETATAFGTIATYQAPRLYGASVAWKY